MQKTLTVVNLAAIRSNALSVRRLINNRFFYAVVKADAYGHGAEDVSRELEDVVDGFCVAIVEEGVKLRVCGVTKPILVFTPPLCEGDVLQMRFYGLTPTVCNTEQALLCGDLPCQIAINTGMNRYGCSLSELNPTLKILQKGQVVGVYSHMFLQESADMCARQLALFGCGADYVLSHSPNAVRHIAASGGVLRGGDYLLDGVRCGLLLYGYAPQGFKAIWAKPAMRVYARLSQKTARVVDGGVGYSAADKKYQNLYTYRLGYADGFARTVPLGERNLCMDAFISEVGREMLPVFTNADEYAKRCGTISYEVLCSVSRRSERIYEGRAQVPLQN